MVVMLSDFTHSYNNACCELPTVFVYGCYSRKLCFVKEPGDGRRIFEYESMLLATFNWFSIPIHGIN